MRYNIGSVGGIQNELTYYWGEEKSESGFRRKFVEKSSKCSREFISTFMLGVPSGALGEGLVYARIRPLCVVKPVIRLG